jgi:dienelactone hydrolase
MTRALQQGIAQMVIRAASFIGCISAVLLALSRPVPVAAAEEAYRTLSPSGVAPHPAVLIVPGCSGFAATNGTNIYDERGADLQAAGYLVVFVDYVGRRLQSNCAHVSQSEVSTDILEAANWTRDQVGVDASRIFVIGWSYGAGGVLAALKAKPAKPSITKAVMYYPVCRGASRWSTAAPGLMLLGAADDVASPALCAAVAKGVPAESLRVITYPNARHGFDRRGLAEGNDQRAGMPVYNAEASVASWTAVRDFLQ